MRYTFAKRRRRLISTSTSYAPMPPGFVAPVNQWYIPVRRGPLGRTMVIKAIVTPRVNGVPGGSPPSRSIRFVGHKPPVGRTQLPCVVTATHTHWVNGSPYGKTATIRVKQVVRPVARPFKVYVPYGTSAPIPPTPPQVRPRIQVIRPTAPRVSRQAFLVWPKMNPINYPRPAIRLAAAPKSLSPPSVPSGTQHHYRVPLPIIKRTCVVRSIPRPDLRPRRDPIRVAWNPAIRKASPRLVQSYPNGVPDPKPGFTILVRPGVRQGSARAILVRSQILGPIAPAALSRPMIRRPSVAASLPRAARPNSLHASFAPTAGATSIRLPIMLRITPSIARPIQSIAAKYKLASPALHDPLSRTQVVSYGKRQPMTSPRPVIAQYPLPANGLPPDIIAASILWLRRNPNVVAAFSDSTGSIKFGSDYLGQVDYPIARFFEPEEVQLFETIDGDGQIPFVTEGSFVVEVTTNVGKLAARQLSDLIGTTLTDAPLSWEGAELMYLRQSKRRFPVTVETGATGSPSLFRRPVEFLYQFEAFDEP